MFHVSPEMKGKGFYFFFLIYLFLLLPTGRVSTVFEIPPGENSQMKCVGFFIFIGRRDKD